MKPIKTESGFLANSAMIISGLAALLGFLGLLGWITGVRRLASFDIHYKPIAPDAAISLIILALILFTFSRRILNPRQIRVGMIFSFIVGVYGLLKVLEFILNTDLTFGHHLLPVNELIQGAPAIRMSPVIGALLCISAIATIITLNVKWSYRFREFVSFIGAFVVLSSLIPFIGYLFGTPLFYGSDVIPPAISALISISLIGLALIILAGRDTFIIEPFAGSTVKSLLLKAFLPLAVFAVLAQGLLNQWLSRTFEFNSAMLSVSVSLLFAVLAMIIVTRISHKVGFRIEQAEQELRKNERELRERNEFIETILQNIQLGIAVHNTQNNMSIYMNPAFEKAYGIKKDDISDVGVFFEKVYTNPVYRQQISDLVMPGLMSGDPDKMKWDNIAVPEPSENARYVSASNIPLHSQNLMISTVIDTTVRNRAENKLRESEERFRSIFENATIGLYRTAPDSRTLLVNPALLKIMGFETYEELKNRMAPNRGYVHAEDAEEFLRQMNEKGEIRGFESVWLRKDGTPVYVRESSRAIKDTNENLLYYEGTVEDITDRKRLLNEQLRLLRVLEKSLNEIYIFDSKSFQFIYVNSGGRKNLGYSTEQLISMTPLSIKPEFTVEKFKELVKPLLEKRLENLVFQTIHQRADGTTYPVEVHLQYIESEFESVFLAVIEDISIRKQAEQAIRSSEERFRAIFDNARDAIFVRPNPAGKMANFTMVNKTACEMLGYSEEQLLTLSPLDLESGRTNQEILDRLQLILDRGVHQFETEFRRADGTSLPVDLNIHVFTLHDTEMILAIARDISARKQLEEQLRQSQKMEAIGRLAGGVAHDFNNLLTVITGYCDLTTMGMDENDPLQSNISEINAAAERAVSLTRQLLAFSRKQALAPKIVDLNVTIAEMEKMLKRIIGEDIALHTVKDENLMKVKVDPGQIEQVIINIAINARDAMPDGGKLIIETANVLLNEDYIVTHPEAAPGHNVLLAITDTGHGMTNDIKSKIFDPFFTTKPLGKGTGLGLSTVFGIVKQSGGSINVYSEPEKGTVFKIYFPIADSQTADVNVRPEYDVEKLRGSETILVVEDEDAVRQVAVRFLETYGYQVYHASSGKEAIENYLVSTIKINLLLTDVIMPNMRGNELANVMRSQQPDLKVIFMSGYTANAIVHDGIIDPGTPYLAKPFSPITLMSKVREVLDSGNY